MNLESGFNKYFFQIKFSTTFIIVQTNTVHILHHLLHAKLKWKLSLHGYDYEVCDINVT